MSAFLSSIKFKIGVAFGICIVLMLVIGASALIGIRALTGNAADMFNGNLMPILNVGVTRSDLTAIRLQVRRAQALHDATKTKDALDRIAVLQGDMKANWASYYPAGISSEKERMLADKIKGNLAQADVQLAEVSALLKQEKYAEVLTFMEEKIIPLAKLIDDDVEQNMVDNLAQAKQSLIENDSSGNAIIWTVSGCILLGLLCGSMSFLFIVRTITLPLQKSIDIANQIADGKLENVVTNHSRDEFMQLLNALARMDVQLTKIVRGIKVSSDTILTASGEIATGNLDLSNRTESQASSLEQTASAMEQLTSTVKQNADNAREANQLAASASRIAVDGGLVVDKVVDTMSSIHASSKKIVDIISVIDGIAFQTNILALNAAVEAARAGEQGRGFAVVASEVRSLAQRSAAAAKEIKVLIDDSVEKVDEGSKLVADAGATMKEVVSSVKRVTHIVSDISSASMEQFAGIEGVNQAISQMDQTTQQNAALVEQAAAAAQSLKDQADSLARSVGLFVMSSDASASIISRPTRDISPLAPQLGSR
jgi:methyl-accepting chemotaxis protein